MKKPAIIHFPMVAALVVKLGRSKYLEGVLVPRIAAITSLMSEIVNSIYTYHY